MLADKYVGELVEELKPEHVVIMSDHGFEGLVHKIGGILVSDLDISNVECIEDVHDLIVNTMTQDDLINKRWEDSGCGNCPESEK